jgi:hypothetical protein
VILRMLQQLGTWLSFRRIFPVAFFLLVFAAAVLQCAFIDPDLWWHLRAGQDIVANGAIPYTDIYSFTKSGAEWVAHEWLSEVLLYGIFRFAGWGGLVVVFSGVITLTIYLVYRRCSGRPYAAAFSVLLAAAAASPLYGIRPQMLSFLLAAIYITVLERFAEDGRARRLFYLVPLMLLWVNLHAGYALGLGLIGLFAVSVALDGKRERALSLLLVLLACAAMAPLNPNGFRMFSYPIETLTSPSMAAYIEEWASPDFHRITFFPLAAMLFTLLGVLALSPRRVRAGTLFLLLVTGFGALRSARHIPIFGLIAAPVIARHLWELMLSRGWERWFVKPELPARGLALVVNCLFLVAAVTAGAGRVWHFVTHQAVYEAVRYPRAAVDYIEQQRLPGPIYNQYGWGGYLIKRLYPEYRVYIDGRADVYGDAFMTEAMQTYDGREGWREPLDRLAVSTVLVAPDAPLASLLRNDSEWKKVYEDRQAVIFNRPLTSVAGLSPENSAAK